MAPLHGVLGAILWNAKDGSSGRRRLFQVPGAHSGEAPWQHRVTERMVGLCKEPPTRMTERGMSENVGELSNWASFTRGQNYQMKVVTLLQLLLGRNLPQLLEDHTNHARLDEQSQATSLAQKIERKKAAQMARAASARVVKHHEWLAGTCCWHWRSHTGKRARAGQGYSVSSGAWQRPAVVQVHERTRVRRTHRKSLDCFRRLLGASRLGTPACHDKSWRRQDN